ncbi:MAG: IPT/TIG domain-containing protein [Solirubrobacterales bacterium]|nr:IPT/TIG domain-containing protein [Solirubrobacterales bacterium]
MAATTVSVGGYSLDVGPEAGISIKIVSEPSKQAAERASALARAVSKDDKARKGTRGPVDDLEIATDRVDEATDQVERADRLWVGVATGHVDVTAVNNEIDTLLALLQKLDKSGRFKEELRVARSLSRLLAVAMRWIELLRTLHEARALAERLGDLDAKAWALHDLGSVYLAGHDLVRADRALTEASDLRRSLGQDHALRATERNLQVLCRTMRQGLREGRILESNRLQRLLHVFNTFLIVLFLLAFGGAITAIAASSLFSSGSAAAVAASINQVLPASGPASGGTIVTVTGTGLAHPRTVRFGRRDGSRVKVISPTQLQVTTPPGSGTVAVTVLTQRGKSLPGSAARFTYTTDATPTITAISPVGGPTTGGTIVTITGQRLAKATRVRFGSQDGTDLKTISPTQLRVDTPPGSGTVAATAITPAGDSVPNPSAQFTYTSPGVPTITGVAPARGPTAGGTLVMITGTNLAHAAAVSFGSADGTSVKPIDDSELQVQSPPGAGIVPVRVSSPSGTSPPSPVARFAYASTLAQTTTALNCPRVPVNTGQSTTCTVTVAPTAAGSASAPTGTVTLTTDSQGSFAPPSRCTLQAPSGGSASCQFTYGPSAPGSAMLTASYQGDTNYAASKATAELTAVNPPPTLRATRTSLVCSSQPIKVPGPPPWTCRVAVADVGSGNETPPTATVSFTTNGGTPSAIACSLLPVSNNSASCAVGVQGKPASSTGTTATGTLQLFPVTADYPGDGTHSGSKAQYSP